MDKKLIKVLEIIKADMINFVQTSENRDNTAIKFYMQTHKLGDEHKDLTKYKDYTYDQILSIASIHAVSKERNYKNKTRDLILALYDKSLQYDIEVIEDCNNEELRNEYYQILNILAICNFRSFDGVNQQVIIPVEDEICSSINNVLKKV